MNSLYQRDKYSSHKSHKCYILLFFFTLGSDHQTLENFIVECTLPFFYCIQKVLGLQWFLKLDNGPTEYHYYTQNYLIVHMVLYRFLTNSVSPKNSCCGG